MSDIAPKIDAYGTKGRATYLADYMEYRAATDQEARLSLLVDIIRDNGWSRRDLDLVEPSSTWVDAEQAVAADDDLLVKIEDGSEDVCARVEAIISYRRRHLMDRYPFALRGEGMGARLQLVDMCRLPQYRSYLALLALTLAHAHSIQVSSLGALSVEDAFEEIVAHCLEASGIPAAVIPTYGDGIKRKVPLVVSRMGLVPQMDLASFSKRAKDAGTDIVCHLPISDLRKHPCFLFLGQATCGQTETWQGKAQQANSAAWRKILLMDYDPYSFLAVPHHVDPKHWPLLAQDSRAPIFDRLRLVPMSETTTTDGSSTVAAVFGIHASAN